MTNHFKEGLTKITVKVVVGHSHYLKYKNFEFCVNNFGVEGEIKGKEVVVAPVDV